MELHTGPYASAKTDAAAEKALNRIRDGRDIASAAGLIVHAGHGLTYRNIRPLARMGGFCEFNIGHSIVSRAVLVGMRQAAEEMIRLLSEG